MNLAAWSMTHYDDRPEIRAACRALGMERCTCTHGPACTQAESLASRAAKLGLTPEAVLAEDARQRERGVLPLDVPPQPGIGGTKKQRQGRLF